MGSNGISTRKMTIPSGNLTYFQRVFFTVRIMTNYHSSYLAELNYFSRAEQLGHLGINPSIQPRHEMRSWSDSSRYDLNIYSILKYYIYIYCFVCIYIYVCVTYMLLYICDIYVTYMLYIWYIHICIYYIYYIYIIV